MATIRDASAFFQCMAASGDCPAAILEITKTADPTVVSAGEKVAFTITTSNTGNYPAYSVMLKDQLSPLTTWTADNPNCTIDASNLLSCTYWTLNQGTSQVVHVSALSSPAMCGTLNNTANVTATHFSNLQASASVDIQCGPKLEVTKTVDDGASTVQVNNPIGFTITVANTGKDTATGVQLKDQLSKLTAWTVSNGLCSVDANGLLTCAFGDIAVGTSASVHVTALTNNQMCGALENTATAWASNYAEVPSNTVSVNIDCGQPGLAVSKTADKTAVNLGEAIGYTLTVTNNGQAKATGVSLSDQLSGLTTWSSNSGLCSINAAGLMTCAFGDLAPSASASVHVSGLSNISMCPSVVNMATAAATGLTPVNSNSVTVNLIGCGESSLAVKKTADASLINAGDPIGFTISVANTGLNPVSDVRLEDQLSSQVKWTANTDLCSVSAAGLLSCGFGTLDPGASASVHVSAQSTTAMCGTLDNIATASATGVAGVQSNPVSVDIHCGAALKVVKTPDKALVELNQPIGFTITVTSAGLEEATNVMLTDQLSSVVAWTVNNSACTIDPATQLMSCSLGTLAVGASVSVHVASTSTRATCGELDNTATATADGVQPVQSSAAIIITHCDLNPVLTIEKAADAALVNAGDRIGFTITIGNTGLEAAYQVQLKDQLSSLVAWTVDNPSCAVDAAGLLTCSFGNLAPGDFFKVHVMAQSSLAMCGQLSNTATTWAINNLNTTSNTVSITIDCGPDLTITKTADAEAVQVNENIGFTITVNNIGNAAATAVQVEDQLNNLVTWTADTTACTINTTTGLMTCALGDLQAGTSVTIHVTAKSGTAVCGEVSNTAAAWASNHERVTSEAAVTVVTCGIPDVSLVKKADKSEVAHGSVATFFLTVTNHGDATAANVTLTDPLPVLTGISWTINAGSDGRCAIAGGILTCKFGSVDPGKVLLVTISTETTDTICAPGIPSLLNNTATVTAANEPNTAPYNTDNTSSASISILCSGPLCVSGGYINNFDTTTPGPQGWAKYITDKAPKGQKFMGQFSNDSTSVSLDCLPAHQYLRLTVDLYVIRSWDGNAVWPDGRTGPGPDRLQISVSGGSILMDTTFTNWKFFKQSYPGTFGIDSYPAQTGAVGLNTLGYQYANKNQDATYHLTFIFPHVGPLVTINFDAIGLQRPDDESWGLDNMTITPMQDLVKYYLVGFNGVP